MALGLKSNPVASELILPTAFETAQCRFPKINRGRETALRCHLSCRWCNRKRYQVKKTWLSKKIVDLIEKYWCRVSTLRLCWVRCFAQPLGFLAPRASKTGVISCPVNYPDSCRGGFTNNICQKRTISQTRPGNCIMGDRSDMILISGNEQADIRDRLGVSVGVSTNLIISANCRLI
jgi:hypothetical protein